MSASAPPPKMERDFSTLIGWQLASKSAARSAHVRQARMFMGTSSRRRGSFAERARAGRDDDSVDAVGVARLHVEAAPDHRPGQRFDVQHHLAVLKQADGAG